MEVTLNDILEAQEAKDLQLKHTMQRDIKRKLEETSEQMKKKQTQQEIDEQWFELCKHYGNAIINLMINEGYGKSKKDKCNRFYGGKCDAQYGHPEWEFADKISDDVIEKAIKFFNEKGYGCEITTSRYFSPEKTMYLWFLDNDEDNAENNVAFNAFSEISW